MQLSVIIPMYNAEKYIKRCIESVYRQDLDINNFELLVVNDGSTDNSPSIVKELQKTYPNITLIDKENGGQATARNMGLEEAHGDYIMFIDADDFLIDYRIKSCLEKTIEYNLDICCMRIQRLLPDGSPVNIPSSAFSDREVYTGRWLLLNGYFPASVCAHFFRREFLLKTGLRLLPGIMHEDVNFQLKLFAYVERFMFCHTFVYVYYYNPLSTDRMMDLAKQKCSIWSNMQICNDLKNFGKKIYMDSDLRIFYMKVSNSQIVAECLNLIRNSGIDTNFRRKIIHESYQCGLLPVKGPCTSLKVDIMKYLINCFVYIYEKRYQ